MNNELNDIDSLFKTEYLQNELQKILQKPKQLDDIERFLNLKNEQIISGNSREFIDKPKVRGEMTCNETIAKAFENRNEKGAENPLFQIKCIKISKNIQQNAKKESDFWHILTKNQTRTFVTHLKKFLQFLKQNYKQDKKQPKQELIEINKLLTEKILKGISNPQQFQHLLRTNSQIVKYAKQFVSPLNTFYKNQINFSKLKNKEFYLQQQKVYYENIPENWSADSLNSKNY